jgi:hypothetical protein
MLARRRRLVGRLYAEEEPHDQGLAALAAAPGESPEGGPPLLHDLKEVALHDPLADAEAAVMPSASLRRLLQAYWIASSISSIQISG